MTLRFYLHSPTVIFEALVDETGSITYPVQDITFDNVSTGAFGDILPGMTVLFGSSQGADDYGRNRIRADATSTVLKIGRSSIGTHDGEIQLVNNAFITVLNDFRIWSKVPYIDADDESEDLGAMFKDGDLEVGTNTTTPPPVANTGPPAAGTIDSGTSKFAVSLPPGGVNQSFAVADSATISSYLWVLPTGCAFTFGTVATDEAIQISADPGFHWISLTVTDSNGKTHTTRTFVYARDPDADDTIGASVIKEHRITRHGQTISVEVTQSIAESTYPDGTICVLMDGEPESQATRRNILFWGWVQTEPASLQATREASLTNTTLKCVDVAGRLDALPGFSQAVYNDVKRENVNPSITWAYMVDPDWDKLLHYIIHWHSTALELTDWQNTGVGSNFPFTVREAGGASLFSQINNQCESLCPAHYFTCDRQGMLACPVDPMLQEVGDRTATVQANIPVSNWSKIRYTHQRSPKVHWLDDSAIVANALVVNGIFSHAPGDSPGQGEMRNTHGEQIAINQTQLNQVTGHRYARMNAPESTFNIQLTQSQDNLIEPAAMEWTTVNIDADAASERGLVLATARGLVSEMVIRYMQTKESVDRDVNLLWERETVGLPAVTVIPPEIPPADDTDPYPGPAETPTDFYGDPKYYIAWDEDNVCRTVDVMASPPTWTKIDTGITGYIIDCQYVARPNGNETVGLWCLTSDGLWWSADILEATPSWTNKRSLVTIQSVETTPDDGLAEIRCLAIDGGYPGRAIIATQPDGSTLTPNANWLHAYFHITHDYGDNWTLCDAADEITYTNSGGTHGHMFISLQGMDWFRVAGGRIYAVRGSTRYSTGGTVENIIMYSDDLGETWVKGNVFASQINGWGDGTILNPHPAATSSLFTIIGGTGVSSRPSLSTGVDDGDTQVEQANPAGFGGCINWNRANSKHNADTHEHHVMVWTRDNDGAPYNCTLFDSDDGGATWNAVIDSLLSENRYRTPNGWPVNTDTWFTIAATSLQPIVQYTDDYYATGMGVDKEGNLDTVAGGWGMVEGRSTTGGIALPKIGLNA